MNSLLKELTIDIRGGCFAEGEWTLPSVCCRRARKKQRAGRIRFETNEYGNAERGRGREAKRKEERGFGRIENGKKWKDERGTGWGKHEKCIVLWYTRTMHDRCTCVHASIKCGMLGHARSTVWWRSTWKLKRIPKGWKRARRLSRRAQASSWLSLYHLFTSVVFALFFVESLRVNTLSTRQTP